MLRKVAVGMVQVLLRRAAVDLPWAVATRTVQAAERSSEAVDQRVVGMDSTP